MLLGIFLVSYELFLGFHSPGGHFFAFQMAAVMVTVFCCIVLYLPACIGANSLMFQGVGWGGAGASRKRVVFIRNADNTGYCVNTLAPLGCCLCQEFVLNSEPLQPLA